MWHQMASESTDIGESSETHLADVSEFAFVYFSLVPFQITSISVIFIALITGIRFGRVIFVLVVYVSLQPRLTAAYFVT